MSDATVGLVEPPPAVLAAIVAVNEAIAASGIAKADENKQQGFKFRGVDAVYEAVAGPMAEHGLFSTSKILCSERAERSSRNGGVLFIVYLTVEYTFHCATDGSSVATEVVAEAMDSGDKATAKAMSVAHRTALLQLSTAPVNKSEPDADSYEVAPPEQGPALEGWSSRDAAKAAHANTAALISSLDDEDREELAKWRKEQGIEGWPLPREAFARLTDFVSGMLDDTEPF